MRNFWWWAAGAAVLATAGTLGLRAADNDSQLFAPARYALLAAPVDVALIQGSGSAGRGHLRQAVFRIDTATGEVWVLQMTVMGGNDPTVRGADWHRVRQPGRRNAAAENNASGW